jgi:hypothetical protein
MKFTITKPVEIEITYVELDLPVKYDDEDMPADFPFRTGDRWNVTVEIETGKILNWPHGVTHDLYMKVTDCGTYRLSDPQHVEHAAIEANYVPHGVVPGDYGDYVELKIDANGIITNWPKRPDVSAFFEGDD